MRVRRRWILFWALRARHQLQCRQDRTKSIRDDAILAFCCLRNEAHRLPHFLEHYRKLGVDQFLIVDNASTDGTAELLAAQPDVSLWSTGHSYKAARFGMNWLGWLLMRYGHNHWCLTVDADEILVYADHPRHGLRDLTAQLDAAGQPLFGALMLEMYPRGRLGAQTYTPGQDPFAGLCWFDPDGYSLCRQKPMMNLWVQGGPRRRVFFAHEPDRAPTLNKIPLVKWNRRWAYANSTHSMLPPGLNLLHDAETARNPTGILLHSKFLPSVIEKSREEKERGEHFRNSTDFDGYYDSLIDDPILWCNSSARFTGWRQLVDLGLMRDISWPDRSV